VEKPFDMNLVDALVARALQQSFDIRSLEPVDYPNRADGIASRILSSSMNAESNGPIESSLVSAGFRLATKLCCRILADPFRVHRGGVRRDVNSILTWLEQRRRDGF
jgi:hypothetical protein